MLSLNISDDICSPIVTSLPSNTQGSPNSSTNRATIINESLFSSSEIHRTGTGMAQAADNVCSPVQHGKQRICFLPPFLLFLYSMDRC